MPTETANYGFTKDNEDEFYNVNTVNTNLDKIDTEMKQIEDELKSFNQQVIDNTNAIANANTKLDTHIKEDIGHTRYIGSTNAVNAWTCSSNLIIWDGTKPKAGVAYRLFAAGANTGAVTLVLSSTNPAITSSTYPVYGMDGKALTAGAVAQGAMVTVCFSGSAFFLQGSGSGVTNVVRGSQSFQTSGSYNFTVPDGVSLISCYLFGAGGGGGGGGKIDGTANFGGGGGGGGAFALRMLQVVPGTNLNIYVGAGGAGGSVGNNGSAGLYSFVTNPSHPGGSKTYFAYGGGGGQSGNLGPGNAGLGGTITATGASGATLGGVDGTLLPPFSIGMELQAYSGGSGGTTGSSSAIGGGGGSSPNDIMPGKSANSNSGGIIPVGNFMSVAGGNGGRGGSANSNAAADGSASGGGGGGGAGYGTAAYMKGGTGGNGRVILVW